MSSNITPRRRVSLAALTSILAITVALALAGCGAQGTSTTSAASTAGESSAATSAAGPSQTLTFDAAASPAGRPRKTADSTATAPWFPPAGTDGLRQQLDKKQIAELTHAISGNDQFWIERPNDHVKPIVFGSDATSILATSAGFSAATVVPVYDVTIDGKGAPAMGAKRVGYQVMLMGDVGATSFGMRPGATPGTWLLDPNGELVNWGGALDAVGRKVGFTPVSAAVVHTTFDLAGRRALYITWAVFTDASGKKVAVTLHNPPAIKATWAIGGQPLRLGTAYDFKTIVAPVTLTPTR